MLTCSLMVEFVEFLEQHSIESSCEGFALYVNVNSDVERDPVDVGRRHYRE